MSMSVSYPSSAEQQVAARRRSAAAKKYEPMSVEILLVAETPPTELDRYFYFDDVIEQDALFRYVSRHILGEAPSRAGKGRTLDALKRRGVFLIDLKENPYDDSSLEDCVPGLVDRCRALDPSKVILIKANVYDLAYSFLSVAGLPVVPLRIYFPSTGRQRQFDEMFPKALEHKVNR